MREFAIRDLNGYILQLAAVSLTAIKQTSP